MSPIASRILAGIRDAMPIPVFLGVVVIVKAFFSPRRFAQSGLPSVATLLMQDLFLGVCTGVVLGLARPLGTSNGGKGIVGFLTAIPPALFVLASHNGRMVLPTRADLITAGIVAALAGVATAAYFSVNEERRRQAQRGDA